MSKQFNRYGEKDVRPGHYEHLLEGQHGPISFSGHDYEGVDWSHDPRSESAREPHHGKGPQEGVTDERIKERVSEVLHFGREVDAQDVDVYVEEGIVYLRGVIKNRRQKKMAQRWIEHLPGVEDVQNELVIKG